jgi:uncharacterized membrane protein
MILLLLAAMLWVGVHIGLSGTALRGVLLGRLGTGGFMAVFSLLSVLAIIALVMAYRHAPYIALFNAPVWLRWLLVLAMLPAFILFVASVAAPNPTAAGQEATLTKQVRGMQRVTRHPMMCAFGIWAAVHIIGNGDAAGLVFFGAFLVTVVAGMPSIDRKLADRDPYGWASLAASTSIVPFGAILAGRNRFVAGEIAWFIPVIGVVAWALTLGAHPHIIGVPAIPN